MELGHSKLQSIFLQFQIAFSNDSTTILILNTARTINLAQVRFREFELPKELLNSCEAIELPQLNVKMRYDRKNRNLDTKQPPSSALENILENNHLTNNFLNITSLQEFDKHYNGDSKLLFEQLEDIQDE